jgi:peptide/nickel transport system permease protein
MIRFSLGRLSSMLIVLLVLAAAVFTLQRLSKTDPVRASIGLRASKEQVAQIRHELGLDRSVFVQYVLYVKGLLHGDMGRSLRTKRPVTTDLAAFLPATAELIAYAFIVSVLLGTALAVASAGRWRGAGALRILLVGGASIPIFLVAVLAQLYLARLGWLPIVGRSSVANPPTGPTHFLTVDSLLHGRWDAFVDAVKHLVIPVTILAIGSAVAIGRVLRGDLAANLRSDWARTARAKGMKERRVLFGHALRNSLGPALAIAGLQIAVLFIGAVIIEPIFSWPGVGLYMSQSISAGDFPAIAGVTLVLGLAYVLANTLVDLLQAAADPRVRL